MKKIKEKFSFKLYKNEKGQLSIFLSVLLILVFTLIAFVVNVGLFVKAKINLQNSIDSAAWSGAAVQSRQLTNISYLNWQMRNVFKEWMFKYYILGQISNPKSHKTSISGAPGDGVDFRLRKFDAASTSEGDLYNLPSTCIHFGSTHNVCAVYQIPGLPRFKVQALANVSEFFEAAVDSFAQTKGRNCSDRSNYNFAAAMSYAYSTGQVRMEDVPAVAGHRTGAWIKAMELAFRMRNLEYIVNRPPLNEICVGGCANTVQNLSSADATQQNSINERPLKAFMAAYKGISGGNFKDEDGFSNTLKITELSPNAFNASPTSLSGFLIPSNSNYHDGGGSPLVKYYLDLIPEIINYATFFTTFASKTGNLAELGIPEAGTVTTDASCASSKTALPVPGYILGFLKNPQIITYYAIKGEANYTGLLNPFGPVNMKVYAAAKPFGGRIGPALLSPGPGVDPNSWTNLKPRDATSKRSMNYMLAFDASADPRNSGTQSPAGLPIPSNPEFYVQPGQSVIGGVPAQNEEVRFAIPNLIYTLPGPTASIQGLPKNAYYTNTNAPINSDEIVGLFDSFQYKKFRESLESTVNEASATMSAEEIDKSIDRALAPTLYDYANFLIPTVTGNGESDSVPNLKPLGVNQVGNPIYAIYAPLFGEYTLYRNQETIKSIIQSYIGVALDRSVEKYLEDIKKASDAIRNAPGGSSGNAGYAEAANSIHENSAQPAQFPFADCANVSLAAKFNFFLRGTELVASDSSCNMLPLMASVSDYLYNLAQDPTARDYHRFSFKVFDGSDNSKRSTGFVPGPDQGATDAGMFTNPLNPGNTFDLRRNSYSTKLVSMKSLLANQTGATYFSTNISNHIYMENADNDTSVYARGKIEGISGNLILNPINPSDLNEFGSDLKF